MRQDALHRGRDGQAAGHCRLHAALLRSGGAAALRGAVERRGARVHGAGLRAAGRHLLPEKIRAFRAGDPGFRHAGPAGG